MMFVNIKANKRNPYIIPYKPTMESNGKLTSFFVAQLMSYKECCANGTTTPLTTTVVKQLYVGG